MEKEFQMPRRARVVLEGSTLHQKRGRIYFLLVSVLYLANANNRLAANGALVQGKDVTLIAGKDLVNAGTLRASNNLSGVAGQPGQHGPGRGWRSS
ncbi:hypothetical protein HX886_34795 [Pseudomonas gingeri]|uniref:Filamentous hemagglutinin n=1 Tax=Pseudomonas gingeri TaxID=117681 RepID=A0A7Y7YJS0_9PSED|nr:hypothetical protein [Pseudomonas gingeri]NWB32090.1 hypothetical protein [Pseudomonas gingeri]NWC37528.1 hypothetical protein [Pseudomonas gingeri]